MARVLPVGIVCVYLGIVLVIGAPSGWRDLGVPGETPSFLDLRSLTSAWVCDRRGIAVLPENPCDPQDRPFNYPRVWLLPSRLGLDEGATVPLGILIAVLFLVTAISLTPRDGPLWAVAAFSAFLCTPGMMLGVERGNVDLLLFCIIVLAVWLFSRPSRCVGSAVLILVASILKLFPIFATPLLLRQPRRHAIAMIASVLVAFGVYVVATLDNVRGILHAVPKSGSFSYGLDILGHPVSEVLGVGDRFVWDVLLAVGAVAAAFLMNRFMRRAPSTSVVPTFEIDAFVTGASVYVLTYVFFRSFDYRLVFLLLALPLLLRRAGERRPEAWATLAAALGALCLESRRVLPEGVFAQYALFILLLAALLPDRSAAAPQPVGLGDS